MNLQKVQQNNAYNVKTKLGMILDRESTHIEGREEMVQNHIL
jgi:hypothetical protein